MIDHELGTMNLTQGAFQEGHVLIPHTDDAFTFSSSNLRCFLRLRRVSVGYVVARPQIVAAADTVLIMTEANRHFLLLVSVTF